MNRVLLTGRLTRDPELRTTAGGKAVAQFSVASHQYVAGKEMSEFHNVVSWDRLAETCGRYLGKGQQVAVEGRIQTRTWDDDKGERHWKTEIVASSVEMLSGRRKKDYARRDRGHRARGPGGRGGLRARRRRADRRRGRLHRRPGRRRRRGRGGRAPRGGRGGRLTTRTLLPATARLPPPAPSPLRAIRADRGRAGAGRSTPPPCGRPRCGRPAGDQAVDLGASRQQRLLARGRGPDRPRRTPRPR